MTTKIKKLWTFLTYDIWRVTESEVDKKTFSLYNIIKTIYITIEKFSGQRINAKAAALTYNTLLALIPILALLFAVAQAFGFVNIIKSQLFENMALDNQSAETIFGLADSYLSQAKGSIFVGVGIVMLLWTVLKLINNIEITFNQIWQVKKGRTVHRKITDYFSMLLLLPLFTILSSGTSIFITSIVQKIENFALLAPFAKFMVRLIPFLITWFMFTGLYMFMPNTRVKIKPALIAGILAGTVFQVFQYLYINGQIWVTKYNAIYGSFAAIPLLLLWLQMSWTICLFGAQLSYTSQNIAHFDFDKDTKNISRRYKDFISVLVMALISKRFERNEIPYTAKEISLEHEIPLRLIKETLYQLQEIGLIHEVLSDKKSEDTSYQPSIDINKLTVGFLLDKIESFGSEDFKIDSANEFSNEWKTLIAVKDYRDSKAGEILVKDL
ncbi:MAG: YihY/virulence factor BrkB family protein [Bacteroides sp.]|nr:YihY/virulence factor BrkB family protein [Bacteroides sp.]NLI63345.1 YihY/virulence factor BrkB family protein [Bacteroidales bacterium]